MVRWFNTVSLLVLTALLACESDDTLIRQAGSVPGNWQMRNEPYPALEEVNARPASALPPYGLYTWCGEYRDNRESIKKIGWKVLRVAGPMDDSTFAMLVEDGMDVMMTLGLRVNDKGRNRSAYADDDAFVADYLAGLHAFMARYGPDGSFFSEHPGLPVRPIREVEIWNEPNFQYMIPDREPRAEVEEEREALYARVLPAAYALIKKSWPGVTVVGFGAGGAGAGDVRFIKAVHGRVADPAGCYDVLSTHPYISPCPPEAFENHANWPSKGYSSIANFGSIREIMNAHGCGNKPVYYTEVGWPVKQEDGGRFETKGDRAKSCVSPGLQAAYVVRQYLQGVRLGVAKTMIMYVTDSDGFNGGFFLQDRSWRQSAHAVRNLIRLLPHPRITRIISEGKDGYFAYGVTPDVNDSGKNEVVVAWTAAGIRDVEIPVTGRGHRMADMVGNSMRLRSMGGTVGITVGPYPVYVTAK